MVVSVGRIGHLAGVAAANGIEVIQLPTAGCATFYASLLRVRGIQLAISHFSRAGYPVFQEVGIPNITFIHNIYAMLAGEALANFRSDDKFVKQYISVSPKATRYAVGRLGIDDRKIVTIPNGLILESHLRREREAVPFSRAKIGLSADDYVFLNVASYNLHKAHYLMAQAISLARHRCDNLKIVCIGNEIYPPHMCELREYLTKHQLDRHILMPGYFEDVAPMHAMSDAFLLPSFIEGWSIAMNEAMFYGKPMILSDTGGAVEVIDREDIGILVPVEYGDVLNIDSTRLDEMAYAPRDYRTAPALATAMIRFAENREHWRVAGKLGRRKVVEQYDFSTVVESYITQIKSVLGRN